MKMVKSLPAPGHVRPSATVMPSRSVLPCRHGRTSRSQSLTKSEKMVDPTDPVDAKHKAMPYSGYYRRDEPREADDLTHSDPQTPLGEYMRRFWQPVCLSAQLEDVPLAIRIMGEISFDFATGAGAAACFHPTCCIRVRRSRSASFR